MNQTEKMPSPTQVAPAAPMRKEERLNDFSAQPIGDDEDTTPIGDAPSTEAPMETGAPNEADARELGYTDDSGHAVSMAKSHDGTHPGPVNG